MTALVLTEADAPYYRRFQAWGDETVGLSASLEPNPLASVADLEFLHGLQHYGWTSRIARFGAHDRP